MRKKKYAEIDKEALAIVWAVRKFHNYIFGQRFTIVIDHEPLTSVLHPQKVILKPVMTAARLQRYALLLSAHNYTIEYWNTKKHANADSLSRLPLAVKAEIDDDYADCFYCEPFEKLPITASTISKESRKHKILSRVFALVLSGNWIIDNELKYFYQEHNELSVC